MPLFRRIARDRPYVSSTKLNSTQNKEEIIKFNTVLAGVATVTLSATVANAEKWGMALACYATNYHSEIAAEFAAVVTEGTGVNWRSWPIPEVCSSVALRSLVRHPKSTLPTHRHNHWQISLAVPSNN